MVKDKTVIYISHRMSSCKFCDRIVVLKEGKIAETGTHQEPVSYTHLDVYKRQGLVTVGSSDCHVREKVGFFATYFPEDVYTMEDFMRVFKSSGCKPCLLYTSRCV